MELNSVLTQIDSLKKEADVLQSVKPEFERIFWGKFRLEFNYNSNHMEGNTLTYGHTQILLKSGDVVGKYNIRELQEMKAHDLALKIIRECAEEKDFSLTEKFIKEINQTILVEPFYNEAITAEGKPTQKLIIPGQYKQTPNSVRLPNGEMHYYPSPEETPAMMGDLMKWYERESRSKELHPVQLSALFHYKFVQIHPFDDSNGRTARLLMNFILLKNGYAPLVIESDDKKNYLIALNEADAGNINAFVEYITSLSERWQWLYLRALKGEKIEAAEDFEKEVALLKNEIAHQKNKNFDPIYPIIKKVFLPLVTITQEKLSKLDDFFTSNSFYTKATDDLGNDYDLETYLDKYYKNKVLIGNKFYFQHRHILLKNSNEKLHFSNYIEIRFTPHTYKLTISPLGKEVERQIDEPLTNEEINEIANEVAKHELNFIKEKVN